MIKGGVLPGGGSALLACRPAIQDLLVQSTNTDEHAAYRIILTALETPFRTLVENGGYSSGAILGRLEGKAPRFGFDIQAGEVVDMLEAGILDVAAVQKEAVNSAIRSASLALTIDAIVHRKKPPVVMDPDAPGI